VSKKEKLIDDAQKLLQKGQTDKAITCYQEALAIDPGDMRLRQRLAELLAKARRLDEARGEFEAIGKNMSANGFYMKAIAVYKQIEKLFPEDVSVAIKLAELNEKHGLIANALSEYKRAFDYFEQQKNNFESLKALEAMQRLDKKNPNIKLKYAEVLFQQGKIEQSLEAFKSLALLLLERRDDTAFGRLSDRIQQLFPENTDFSLSVIERKIQEGGYEQAITVLQEHIKLNPHQLKAWQLLVMACQAAENLSRLKVVCNHFIRLFPEEPYPREALVRCLIAEHDQKAALTLLEESEQVFIVSGAAAILKALYISLNDLSPLNDKVLKGCYRACEANGNEEEAAAYFSKSNSISTLASSPFSQDTEAEEELLSTEINADIEIEDLQGLLPEIEDIDETVNIRSEEQLEMESTTDVTQKNVTDIADSFDNDFYEIEVELDDDFSITEIAKPNTWFETVNDIFDNIQTETGKVRFGEGIDNGDAQSQYDLGLAFYEMGLYDEAINAFRQAAELPGRRIACLILQGACLRDKGDFQLAENALRALLASPELSLEDSCALKYELALTCAAQGNHNQARIFFEEVELLDSAFRDVGRRLRLSSEEEGKGTDLDFSEEELLNFELK